MLKSALVIGVLLLMAAADLHYPFYHHINHPTEPSIRTNIPLPARLALSISTKDMADIPHAA